MYEGNWKYLELKSYGDERFYEIKASLSPRYIEKSSFLNEQNVLDSKDENLMLYYMKKSYYDIRMILEQFAITFEKVAMVN